MIDCCRMSRLVRSRLWNRQEMSSVPSILLSSRLYDARLWMQSRLLDDAYFLVASVSLKTYNLLRTERLERFGTLIVVRLFMLAL